jgi:hypothetical protein
MGYDDALSAVAEEAGIEPRGMAKRLKEGRRAENATRSVPSCDREGAEPAE